MTSPETDGRLVEQARDQLLALISSGQLQPGDRLGTERDLATRLGISRATLRQALDALARAGAVRRIPGRTGGTFVSAPKLDRDLSTVVGLPEYLRRQGFAAGTRVLSALMIGADGLTAGHLGLAPGSLVFDIARIRLADGVPISLERARLPAEIVPGLLDLPLGGSMYELLDRHYGIRPDDVVEHLEVADAGADEAALLGISVGRPLLAVTRVSRTAAGLAFEYSEDLFRADRTRVTFRTRAERAEIAARGAGEVAGTQPPTAW